MSPRNQARGERDVRRLIARAAANGADRLELAGLNLETLPEEIGDLTGLTRLDLSGNRLSTLPDSLGRLSGLTDLDLSGNRLVSLPPSLGRLTGLEHLDLADNRIDILPDLAGLTALTHLNLHGNLLADLPEHLTRLPALTWLDLADNQLAALPEGIGALTELTWLGLARNQLSRLPETLGALARLTWLNLHKNRLSDLPDSLGGLRWLSSFEVGDNPLDRLPPEVTALGSAAVLAFLRAQNAGSIEQWTSKVMVVGQGGVGKTSLVKALSGVAHDHQEPMTHGMRVTDLHLTHPERPDVTMTLSVWDFGGQEIYHATHQFFLTDRSLFILVWDARVGEGPAELYYWLRIITAHAPKAPVLLVATHTDERSADLDLHGLRTDFPQLEDQLFSVDCPQRTGVSHLLAAVTAKAAALPLMGTTWPTSWSRAATALAVHPEPYCTADQMRQVMAAARVTDADAQRTLALALSHRGQILYHADDEELADTVVLRPEWLNTHISEVVVHPGTLKRGGILTKDDLEIWKDVNPPQRRYLLAMMDRFNLSYPVSDATDGALAVLVNLLPARPPEYQEIWDGLLGQPGSQEIRLLYELPVLPPGIPGWFLAREHRFATGQHWRTGAVLRYTDGLHHGLLRADLQRHTVELAVRGPRPAGFFAILDDGLNLTFSRYPGLEITRQVPCPGHAGRPCTKLFDAQRLTSRFDQGHRDIYCDVSDDMSDLASMLVGIPATAREMANVGIRESEARINRRLKQQDDDLQREFLHLRTLISKSQQDHCPSVFTLVPAKRVPGISTKYTLRLYCEEPGSWHPLPGNDACYPITELSDWLRKAGPYIARTLQLLTAAAPIARAVLGVAAEELHGQIKHDIEQTRTLLEHEIPHPEILSRGSSAISGLTGHDAPSRYGTSEADFRQLSAMLVKLDPARQWGGLSYTQTPEGLGLYLCPEHRGQYA